MVLPGCLPRESFRQGYAEAICRQQVECGVIPASHYADCRDSYESAVGTCTGYSSPRAKGCINQINEVGCSQFSDDPGGLLEVWDACDTVCRDDGVDTY